MITVEGEKIDAHSHMGARKKLAIHQIPPIMKFMAEDMLQSMDNAGVDGVVTFAIGSVSHRITEKQTSTSPMP